MNSANRGTAFEHLDLNLLVTFEAIYQERNLTRAAKRLFVTQSAVSHGLSRLREQLGDPLFVRRASGVEPTPATVRLAPKVQEALHLLRRALETDQFEPARDLGRVRIAIHEELEHRRDRRRSSSYCSRSAAGSGEVLVARPKASGPVRRTGSGRSCTSGILCMSRYASSAPSAGCVVDASIKPSEKPRSPPPCEKISGSFGIDKYEALNQLQRAVNDACAVAKRLLEKFRFPAENVFMFVDHVTDEVPEPLRARCKLPSKVEIERLLFDELPEKLGPDDRLLFFYAGHGEPKQVAGSDHKDWYLVPIVSDADELMGRDQADVRNQIENSLTALGFARENITWISSARISGNELSDAFRQLVQNPDDPALFILERVGFTDPGDGRMVVHGTDLSHLPLAGDLALLASGHRALTSILPEVMKTASIGPSDTMEARIGTCTIWIRDSGLQRDITVPNPSGVLHLLEALSKDGVWRVHQWLAEARLIGSAELVGDPQARIFDHPDDVRVIASVFREITEAPLMEAVSLLEKMKHQPTAAGEEARLFLGATRIAQGQADDGLRIVDEALRIREQRGKEGYGDDVMYASGQVFWPAAHYYRGVAFLALAPPRLGQAVDAFTLAVEQDAGDARVLYHRAVTIQRLIDEDLATQAQGARDAYELHGAPVGPMPKSLAIGDSPSPTI